MALRTLRPSSAPPPPECRARRKGSRPPGLHALSLSSGSRSPDDLTPQLPAPVPTLGLPALPGTSPTDQGFCQTITITRGRTDSLPGLQHQPLRSVNKRIVFGCIEFTPDFSHKRSEVALASPSIDFLLCFFTPEGAALSQTLDTRVRLPRRPHRGGLPPGTRCERRQAL